MPYLGTPYRLIYEAKSLRSGLNDVKAFIVKPDSTVAGIFAMAEVPLVTFQGVYVYDLMTSNNDPEGEWLGIFLSPSEGVKYTFRISLQKNPAAVIQAMISNFLANGIREEITGHVELAGEYLAFVGSDPELTGYVLDQGLSGEIEDAEATGLLGESVEIEGDIDHEL